jgi:predicted nucleic acid-binding protein
MPLVRWSTTALSAEPPLYLDSSALVKRVISETESDALVAYLADGDRVLATSSIAMVEVRRATAVANPAPEVQAETDRMLESCLLVEVTDSLLREAARLTSLAVRTLDAIHLASALHIGAVEMVVYDRRLGDAARAQRLIVIHPGMDAQATGVSELDDLRATGDLEPASLDMDDLPLPLKRRPGQERPSQVLNRRRQQER